MCCPCIILFFGRVIILTVGAGDLPECLAFSISSFQINIQINKLCEKVFCELGFISKLVNTLAMFMFLDI